ncbi:FCD domain-containing protein [Microbispora triticiradicis]|uniref:FCD domain-containing protein n=1 Tax=Microbispora triticiradicis TaxID=2200763 RepID=UPI001FCBF7B0|nr:FCD domain-containing protein [Microbispora fusca]
MPAIAQVIREALARLDTHVHLLRLLHDSQVTHLAMAEHEVVAAIAARDPDAAAYAMRRHILRERFRRLFDEVKGSDGMAVKA